MYVRKILLSWFLVAAVTTVARADIVELANGEIFEDVVVELLETRLRIHLDIGQLDVPLEEIANVRRIETSLERFMRRRDQLLAQDLSQASEWLDLARWAQARRLATAARQALRIAAELDPYLEGLDRLMKRHGYVFDAERDAWVHRPEQQQVALQLPEPRTQEPERSGEAEVALAALELAGKVIGGSEGARQPEPIGEGRRPQALGSYVGYPHVPHRVLSRPAPTWNAWRSLAIRQPGSLIPLTEKNFPPD